MVAAPLTPARTCRGTCTGRGTAGVSARARPPRCPARPARPPTRRAPPSRTPDTAGTPRPRRLRRLLFFFFRHKLNLRREHARGQEPRRVRLRASLELLDRVEVPAAGPGKRQRVHEPRRAPTRRRSRRRELHRELAGDAPARALRVGRARDGRSERRVRQKSTRTRVDDVLAEGVVPVLRPHTGVHVREARFQVVAAPAKLAHQDDARLRVSGVRRVRRIPRLVARAAKVVRARLFGLTRGHHGQVVFPQHHQPRASSVVPLERVAEARRTRERLGELPVETGPQAPGGHHEHQVLFGHGAVVDERKLEPLRGERAVQIARAQRQVHHVRHLACGGDARHLHAYARGSREAPRVQRAVRVALRVRGEAHGQAAPGALREDAFCFRGTRRLVVQRVQRAFVDAHGRAALAQREELARVDQRRGVAGVGGEAKKVGKREVSLVGLRPRAANRDAFIDAGALLRREPRRAHELDPRAHGHGRVGFVARVLERTRERRAVAVEPVRVLGVAHAAPPGPDAEQRAPQVLGDRARDLVGAQGTHGVVAARLQAAAPGPRRNRVPRPRGGGQRPRSRQGHVDGVLAPRGLRARRRGRTPAGGGVPRPAIPAREVRRGRAAERRAGAEMRRPGHDHARQRSD